MTRKQEATLQELLSQVSAALADHGRLGKRLRLLKLMLQNAVNRGEVAAAEKKLNRDRRPKGLPEGPGIFPGLGRSVSDAIRPKTAAPKKRKRST
jgi:hypothetical protein